MDQHTADHLEAILTNPARNIKSMVLGYLTCIAPGGELTAAQAAQFNQRFHEDKDGEYHARLVLIDNAFAWRRGAWFTLNAEPPIRQIMLGLENPTQTWFGYGAVAVFPETASSPGLPSRWSRHVRTRNF